MILACDSSTSLTSVALVADDGGVIAEASHEDPRRHAEVIGTLLADVISRVDRSAVTAIACGVGPGPYTGLRVGIAAANAVGVAWGLPVHGLCSLDALAMRVIADHPGAGVEVATDARRSEAYWASYDATGQRVEGPRVRPTDALPDSVVRGLPHAVWVGRRVQALLAQGAPVSHADLPLDVHGQDTGATARALGGAGLLLPRPLYLRRPDAMVPGTRGVRSGQEQGLGGGA